MNTISTTCLPDECFVYQNRQYSLRHKHLELPYTHADYECILKAHGIPYRKVIKNSFTSSEVCEYWNPNIYEEKELTLPLYVRIPNGSYRYAEKNYTEKLPTDETIKAALEIQKFIDIADFRGVDLNPYTALEIDMNKDNFKIFKLKDWLVFFDMHQIKSNVYVELKVPKYIAGLVIGVRSSIVKKWAEELGVKKIQVVPV